MALSPRDFNTSRNIAIDAEEEIDFTYDTVYLFTWNPKDKFFPDGNNYVMKWDTMLCRVIKHLTRCMSKFCIIPEVSDNGRLHCHGWFVIKDKVKWNKSVRQIIARHGFMKMNRLRATAGFDYYKKDMDTLSGYLPGRQTVITKANLRKALREIALCYFRSAKCTEAGRVTRSSVADYLNEVHGDDLVDLNYIIDFAPVDE